MDERAFEAIYPLSPMQQGMLFHTLLEPDLGTYVQRLLCRLLGPLDHAAFRFAWEGALARHSALRTAFAWERRSTPLQVVLSSVPLPLTVVDASALPPESRSVLVSQLLAQDRSLGFAFDRAPLLRLFLIRLDAQEWLLVWSHHHLLLDGWSTGIVLQEVCDLYAALREGRRLSLPPVRPYREYVAWLQRQPADAAERFWRSALADFSSPTPLGVDHRETPCAGERFAERRRGLPFGLVQSAAAAGGGHPVTAGCLLAAAWGLLLSRNSGKQDVLFGVTVAGRPAELPGVESMVGLLINTIPLRLWSRPEEPLADWLRAVQDRLLAARAHEHTPLVDVQAWSGVPASTHLFESLFVHESYPPGALTNRAFAGLRIAGAELQERTNFPLNLVTEPSGDDLRVRLIYDRSRIDDLQAERLLGQIELLLVWLADSAGPLARVGEIPRTTEAERHQIVREWNPVPISFEREVCLHELFERSVARAPAAVALVDPRRGEVTYQQLDEEAERLACRLPAAGVLPGSFVGIHLGRGVEMVAAVLAVLKAGAAYVPLDLSSPVARLSHIVAALKVPCVISDQAGLATLGRLEGPYPGHVICVDGDPGPDAAISAVATGRRVPADAFAYTIFTSGSTGMPKGVQVRHRAVVNLIEWAAGRYGMSPRDRVLFVTALSFDLSVFDLFGVLATGGSVRIAGEGELEDPGRLAEILLNEPITFWDSAPAALQQIVPFLPETMAGGCPLRLVFLSGDWVPLGLPGRLRTTFPAARVVALGGATEATVWSNVFDVEEIDPRWRSIPYGRPIQNAAYHVLDEALEPCPAGVAGDLYIGGECLMTAYAAAADLTAERLIPDLHGGAAGGRLYRTGDRARYLADGNLEFLGRLDGQVKIRGFRIELGEIESLLARHPAVRDAVAAVHEPRPGDRRLVAYAVPAGPEQPAAADMRDFLRRHLPSSMVPSAFRWLDALPLTANGKLDRRALPPPDAGGTTADDASVRPLDPFQESVAGIWEDVLQRDRIGLEADFFADLGGHSLLATQVVARLQESLGIVLPLRTFFDHPTVAGLARVLAARTAEGGGETRPPLERIPRGEPLELSHAQARLWFLDRLQPASALYNVPLAARLDGALDVPVLERCLAEILARHEVLRTSFRLLEGRPVQVVAGRCCVPLEVVDLDALPAGERELQGVSVLCEEAIRPFDLAVAPLLRVTVVRLAVDMHLVLLLMHHIVADGWSMGVLLRELTVLYPEFLAGRPSPLPPLAFQYADYAAWQRRWLTLERQERLSATWSERLAGAPLLEIPSDRPRMAVARFRGRVCPFDLTEDLSRKLRTTARHEGGTLFMVLLAAFEILLAWKSGRRDLLVGTDVANRDHSEIEGLIGFFVNQLALRVDLSGDPSFREVLRRVRRVTLEAYTAQDLPFDLLVRAVNPDRGEGTMPLFCVKLVLQNAPTANLDLPGLRVQPLLLGTETAKYDVLLTIEDRPRLTGTLEYDTDLFEPATARGLVESYQRLLERVADAPDAGFRELLAWLEEAARSRGDQRERDLRREALQRLRSVRRQRAAAPEEASF